MAERKAERETNTEDGKTIHWYELDLSDDSEILDLTRTDSQVTMGGYTFFNRAVLGKFRTLLPESELKNALLNPNNAAYRYVFFSRPEELAFVKSPLGLSHARFTSYEVTWDNLKIDGFEVDPIAYEEKLGNFNLKFFVPLPGHPYSFGIVYSKEQGLSVKDSLTSGPGLVVVKWPTSPVVE